MHEQGLRPTVKGNRVGMNQRGSVGLRARNDDPREFDLVTNPASAEIGSPISNDSPQANGTVAGNANVREV